MVEIRARSWLLADFFLLAAVPFAVYALAPRRCAPLPATTAARTAHITPPSASATPPSVVATMLHARARHLASIFGRDSAAADDSQDVLGGLVGSQIAEADAVGGMGLVGSGKAGVGDGTIGLGALSNGPLHVCQSRDFDDNCIDFAIFKRAVRDQQREARACLDRARREHPRLRARITIDFRVNAAGSVSDPGVCSAAAGTCGLPFAYSDVPADADENDPALATVEQCLVRAVSQWKIEPEWLRQSLMSYYYHLRY